jgi:predicted RNA-binding Zn-ribbon protein involved in translation (DUF1610 family)
MIMSYPDPDDEIHAGDQVVVSTCPNCGSVASRTAYDIGSGPELACATCEWCWGANGQPLKPLDIDAIRQEIKEARTRGSN